MTAKKKPRVHNADGKGCPYHAPGCSPAYLCTQCTDGLLAETFGTEQGEWTVLNLDQV